MHPSWVPLWDTPGIEQEECLTMWPREGPWQPQTGGAMAAPQLGRGLQQTSQLVGVQPSGAAPGLLTCTSRASSAKREEGAATGA